MVKQQRRQPEPMGQQLHRRHDSRHRLRVFSS